MFLADSENNLPALYLIPNFVGVENWSYHFPEINKKIICSLKYFIAEDVKACRALLKHAGYSDISQANIEEYNEHHFDKDVSYLLSPIDKKESIGLVSEAGVPAIADPGDEVVRLAHQKNIRVVPLVGASSVMLSVMSAGLNGNSFAFNGYLPIEMPQKVRKIKELEQFSLHKKQAQFFIETPYRNQKLLSLLLQVLHSDTLLSIACNLMCEDQTIQTRRVAEWKNRELPDIQKRPCVFGILKM
ncbi:MAG: SAM-dependent methyltransferase [Bacteroidia bacterium]|nr:SAM-dependent methyltransferase [Bacteroidia bacterium]